MSLVQPSLDTVRLTVGPTNPQYGLVLAEFQHSVVERNITFSQMKKFCILQGSVMIFFRCGG